jgi:hypothetical protein
MFRLPTLTLTPASVNSHERLHNHPVVAAIQVYVLLQVQVQSGAGRCSAGAGRQAGAGAGPLWQEVCYPAARTDAAPAKHWLQPYS